MSTEPNAAQRAWMDLGYGMFIHFGPNAFTGTGWGDGRFPAEAFNPVRLDATQWARVAAEAGMRYAVLTTKHHDGFCLWPTAATDYCVRMSPGQPDVVRQFVTAFRAAGLKVGLYYSLWDRNCAFYGDDIRYADFMRRQMTELLTEYGDIVELWFDGGWDKDHPTRQWPYDSAWEKDPNSGLLQGERWEWHRLYEHIHALQPNCMVIQNSSSDRPGVVKYLPEDARTSEHFDFIYRDEARPAVTECVHRDANGEELFLPLEYCTTLNPGWFWARGSEYSHPSAEAIASWYRRARSTEANLLLNVGPTSEGLIPEYHRHFLREAAELGAGR